MIIHRIQSLAPFTTSLVLALSLSLSGCAATAPAPTGVTAPMGTGAAGASSLDGTSYDVSLAFPGEAVVKDTLRFEGGRFESTACTAVGFPQWSNYDATQESGALAFAALVRNPDGTTLDWHGTVRGDVVDATATRTMGGKTSTATVHGSRR
jgi:hypothetical protein